MCWKHSSEHLVHIDMIASDSCCKFVENLNWIDLVIVEAIFNSNSECFL